MPKMWTKKTNELAWTIALFCVRAALIIAFVVAAVVAANAQSKEELKEIIVNAAKEHGVNPQLMLAMAHVESSYNPRAVGGIGERGLFQLRPEFFGKDASFNPRVNAQAAAKYLAWLKKRPGCAKHGRAYYVCYNAGATKAATFDNAKEHKYYKKVEAYRTQIASQE